MKDIQGASNPLQWMRTHGNEHWEFDDSGSA